jgi:hypothetical protein
MKYVTIESARERPGASELRRKAAQAKAGLRGSPPAPAEGRLASEAVPVRLVSEEERIQLVSEEERVQLVSEAVPVRLVYDVQKANDKMTRFKRQCRSEATWDGSARNFCARVHFSHQTSSP